MSTVAVQSTRPFDVYWTELRRRAFRLSVTMAAVVGEMPFLEHLEELRTRLIRALIAVGARLHSVLVFFASVVRFRGAPDHENRRRQPRH